MKEKKNNKKELTVAQRRRQAAEKYRKETISENFNIDIPESDFVVVKENKSALPEEEEVLESAIWDEEIMPIDIEGDLEIKNERPEKDEPKLSAGKKVSVVLIALICAFAIGIIISGTIYLDRFSKMEMFGGSSQNVELDEVQDGVFTCLLVATDKGKLNTDTIMLVVVRYEGEKQIDLISIPRDTRVVNPHSGSGYVKINSLLARNNGSVETLVEKVREITGIPINNFMLIDIEGVKKTVDMFGGVYFDVPMDMDYEDPTQDLYIHLKKGYQLIDGDKAEQLLRFRSGYATADLGRTETQRAFMAEAFRQHANVGNLTKIPLWYSEMGNYVETKITGDDAYEIARVVVGSDFNLKTNILPGTTITGSPDYFYDAKRVEELAKSLGFEDADVKATPAPVINVDSGEDFGEEDEDEPASDVPDEEPLEDERKPEDEEKPRPSPSKEPDSDEEEPKPKPPAEDEYPDGI